MTKITKEEFNKLQPRCSCYDHELIPWKEHYRYTGIPKCLKGHGTKKKNIVTKEEFERTCPHYCECERKCGNEIIWKEHYKYRGIPKYSHGHNAPLIGKPLSEKQKENMSISRKGKFCGENHPMYGRHHTPESNQKNREKHLGVKRTEEAVIKQIKTYKQNNSGENSPSYGTKASPETKQKMSDSHRGEKSHLWKGGISYLPYCPRFNDAKKEEVRNEYDRKCLLCGTDEKDNRYKNGKLKKLDIHHVDYDKEQGCNGKKWELVPLCIKCHPKIISNAEKIQENIRYLITLHKISPFMKMLFC